MSKKFKCIKGVHDDGNVLCLQGDIVELYSVDHDEIGVKGIFGWVDNAEFTFTAKEFAESFCVWVPTAIVG